LVAWRFGCGYWRRSGSRCGRRRHPFAILVKEKCSSQNHEARHKIDVIALLGFLGQRKQPLHRPFEDDDQGGYERAHEHGIVAME
jgi:hypothetical protein